MSLNRNMSDAMPELTGTLRKLTDDELKDLWLNHIETVFARYRQLVGDEIADLIEAEEEPEDVDSIKARLWK